MSMVVLNKRYGESSYKKGLIGGILGALGILVPWILLKVFFDFNGAPFGYFLGLAIYKGYTFNGGKIGERRRWIILITSIVFLIIAQIGLMIIELIRGNLKITIVNIGGLFYENGGLSRLGFNMIFAIMLMYPFIKPIFKELKCNVEK